MVKGHEYSIEEDWTTEAGFRAQCIWSDTLRHRCGYVAIPPEHPLHGVGYGESTEALRPCLATVLDGPKGKRGIISCVLAAGGEDHQLTPEFIINVHGSLTFSAADKNDGTWWFGFDCGHLDDTPGKCTQSYVTAKCESLAQQLRAIESLPKISLWRRFVGWLRTLRG